MEPEDRTEKDIEFLSGIFKHMSFFEKLKLNSLPKGIQENCFRLMRFQQHRAGTTLFKHGDKGGLFYVVLKGSASVWIPIPQKKELTRLELIKLLFNN